VGLIAGTPHRWLAWTSKQSSGWPVKNFGQLSSFLEGGVRVLDLSVYNVYDCSLFLLTFISYSSRCCKAPLHWRSVTVKNANSSNTGFTCLGFFGIATTNYDCFCMLSHCQTNHSSLTTILSTLVTVIVLTFSQWHFVNVNAPLDETRWNFHFQNELFYRKHQPELLVIMCLDWLFRGWQFLRVSFRSNQRTLKSKRAFCKMPIQIPPCYF